MGFICQTPIDMFIKWVNSIPTEFDIDPLSLNPNFLTLYHVCIMFLGKDEPRVGPKGARPPLA